MTATFWHAGLIASLAVLLLVPLIKLFCAKFRVYDLPGPLKIHTRPIPRIGGVAIAVAVVLGLAALRLPIQRSVSFLFLAVALVWAASLIDDVRGLHPAIRLAAQIIAALLLVHAGWKIPLSGNSALDAIATCAYFVLFINAFNFLDGADGIAAGVAATINIGYIALPVVPSNALGHAIAWSLLEACAGFLLFNFPPAKLFMGDSGSSMLGFATALLGLALCRETGPAKSALTPILFSVLVAALPPIDAVVAILRRIRQRASPLYGDRRHFYDLLLARGCTACQVAFVCYAITGGLVIAGWCILRMESREALISSVLVGCTLFAIEVGMGAMRSQDASRKGLSQEDLRWRGMADHALREKV